MSWLVGRTFRFLHANPVFSTTKLSLATFKVEHSFSQTCLDRFTDLSKDSNPIHDSGLVPGALVVSVVNGVLGSNLASAMVVWQETHFVKTCHVDQSLTFTVTVDEPDRKMSACHYQVTNEDNEVVIRGKAKIIINKRGNI